MKVILAADHRGYDAKRKLLPLLKQMGHEVQDMGCSSSTPCDYIDYAVPAARAVAEGRADVGILVDGSGIGMSIAANKIYGVLAALSHDEITARIARENNHCNVLCIGSDLHSEAHIRKIVQVFLETGFGEGRHARRVAKLRQIEQEERLAPAQQRRIAIGS